ncbi:MAG: hypothetical protein IJU47_02865 [Verrucomicrobia bacterium]|nr:hypothetical protein [Verrucomicrobiota bacterium]
MPLLKIISLGMKIYTLCRKGKNIYGKAEMVKDRIEKTQAYADHVYEKAGRPDSAQIGAALGRGAGRAFLKFKKWQQSRSEEDKL